jgi:heme/copper-type cytochrome/quinol oxidase subunit 3
VGNDPFGGETLEWSTSSPPPSYNFAVIPRVRSAYAMWDREDREEDARRLDRGEQVLSDGHETPSTTALDADWDAVLDMPPSSPWPPVFALMLAGTFGSLLLHHYVLAAIFVGLAALVLVGWHSQPAAAHLVDKARRAIPNGVWGMSLGLAAEVALFGSVLASYFYLRFQNPSWPPAGIDPPSVTAPLALTGGLLLSTVPMALAVRAGDVGRKRFWLLMVLAIQAIYLGWQIHLFGHDLHDFSPSRTAYGSIYFTMLALHHAHVLVGIALVGWAIAATRPVAVRAIGVYIYVVNVLAIFVVLTQLSPSL